MESKLSEVIVNGKTVKYEAITVEKNSLEGDDLSKAGYSLATECSTYGVNGKSFWTYIKILSCD